MKNKLADLNDHLFAQLERLREDGLTPEQLDAEVKRSAAIVDLADQITESSKLRLMAARLYAEHGEKVLPMLPLIGKSGE